MSLKYEPSLERLRIPDKWMFLSADPGPQRDASPEAGSIKRGESLYSLQSKRGESNAQGQPPDTDKTPDKFHKTASNVEGPLSVLSSVAGWGGGATPRHFCVTESVYEVVLQK